MQDKDYFTYEGSLDKKHLETWIKRKISLLPYNYKSLQEVDEYNKEFLHNKESMIVYTGNDPKEKKTFRELCKNMVLHHPKLNFAILTQ